jgi:DNA ligase-1
MSREPVSTGENPMPILPANAFEQFARTAEAVSATTKKLQKAALLGEYFEHLADDDLARAAR